MKRNEKVGQDVSRRVRKRGQGITEYIIIVGLIAVVLVTAVNTFRGALYNAFLKGAEQIEQKITEEMDR